MRVPVIILNWNGWEDTFACLESIRGSDCADEVWLVDNGSAQDRSPECLVMLPTLRVLMLGENFGWAGAYNRALKLAAAEGFEIAYLLNNDTLVSSGFLTAAREAMLQDTGLAA